MRLFQKYEDYAHARTLYVMHGLSCKEIARQIKLPLKRIQKWCADDKWTEQRDEYDKNQREAIIRHQRAESSMLDRIAEHSAAGTAEGDREAHKLSLAYAALKNKSDGTAHPKEALPSDDDLRKLAIYVLDTLTQKYKNDAPKYMALRGMEKDIIETIENYADRN